MATLSENFLSEDELEAVLATFCCYDYVSNASEVYNQNNNEKGER